MPEGSSSATTVVRCAWGDEPDYHAYHDDEWGRPVADDARLFEKLCLEGFQAGLSWLTILRKREAFRRAFAGFDPAGRALHRRRRRAPARDAGSSATAARSRRPSTTPSARRAGATEGSLAATSGVRARGRGRTTPTAAARPSRRAGEGAQAPRLAVRRPDDRLRVHAGHGPRQRPPARLRRTRRRANGSARRSSSPSR